MREFARRLRAEADNVEHIVAPLSLPQSNDFRGRAADSFRARRDDIRQRTRAQRDQLHELASWIDGRANELQRQIDEARRLAEEAERRRQQMLNWWPWRR